MGKAGVKNDTISKCAEEKLDAHKAVDDRECAGVNIVTSETLGSESGTYSITKEVEERIIKSAEDKAMEIYNTQSKKAAGPCLSTVYDPLIDQNYKDLNPLYFGQNYKTTPMGKEEYLHWIYNDADPIIRERFLKYTDQVLKKEIILPEFVDTRLAAHSEIRALDEAIKVRRSLGLPVTEDIINELYVYNIDLRNMYSTGKVGIPSMIPKCRCPNCLKLTDGINTLRHE